MLSVTKFPYTGPLAPGVKNRGTVKGLKRAQIRLGYLDAPLGSETDDWGAALTEAFKTWWKEEVSSSQKWTGYGKGSWLALRGAKLTSGPNKGQYAMDAKALAYVREDALTMCYPHPAGVSGVYVGQGPHQSDGLPWTNIAVDFMAPGGTKVLAVENAEITRLSGHDPGEGAWGPGIFGWSIYYRTAAGIEWFSTHYGTRVVSVGSQVDCGEVIGTVGRWPGDPGRSHTHLGCSHPNGRAAATAHILKVTQAKKVTV